MKVPNSTTRQAIETRILPATNTRPTRIVAECERGRSIICADTMGDAGHEKAVCALVARFLREDEAKYGTDPKKNPWGRSFVMGTTRKGYVAVFVWF